MLGLDARAFRITWTVLLVTALVWLLYHVRSTLFVFTLAVLFAYVIWPLVALLESLWARATPAPRTARLLALAVVYPVLLGLAVLAVTVVVPQAVRQAATLFEKVTAFASSSQLERSQLLDQMSRSRGWSLPALYALRDQILKHAGEILPYLQEAATQLLRYLSNLWVIVLVPILSFFLLKDADRLAAAAESWLTDAKQRDLLRQIFTDLHDLLAHYMRGLILLSLLSFAAQLVFFLIAGVPYGLLLATLAGLLEFIPLVGPLTAAAIILGASWLAGYSHLVLVAVFLGAWRLVQDYVNAPWILSAGVELHPLVVIFGVLAGAEVAGVAGMFLSVPVMAAGRVLLRRGMVESPRAGAARRAS